MKRLLLSLLILTACGSGGGGDDTTSNPVINNCGNKAYKNDVTITCNITDSEAQTDLACSKCGDNYVNCISNPGENGLEDDSLCLEIYNTCLDVNKCND